MSEFTPGERVAVYSFRSFGSPSLRWSTIERVTKTQYVLASGARYRKADRREVGVDRYRSTELLAADDSRIGEATKIQERQRLVTAVWNEWDGWRRDRRATPVGLAKAAQALVDYDTEDAR